VAIASLTAPAAPAAPATPVTLEHEPVNVVLLQSRWLFWLSETPMVKLLLMLSLPKRLLVVLLKLLPPLLLICKN
jgi:hypothetical protein